MLLYKEAFFIFALMENVAFIINPFSAKKNYQPFLEELKKKVENPLYYISESIQGTDDFIQENFSEYRYFCSHRRRWYISTIARNLINTSKILAIFPAGSGNGFSNETNFRKNLDELLEKIKINKSRKIDTFTVNDKLSINVSGTGFDGKVVKEFEKQAEDLKIISKSLLKLF
jgi:diacylglycerol kinase family enzyme